MECLIPRKHNWKFCINRNIFHRDIKENASGCFSCLNIRQKHPLAFSFVPPNSPTSLYITWQKQQITDSCWWDWKCQLDQLLLNILYTVQWLTTEQCNTKQTHPVYCQNFAKWQTISLTASLNTLNTNLSVYTTGHERTIRITTDCWYPVSSAGFGQGALFVSKQGSLHRPYMKPAKISIRITARKHYKPGWCHSPKTRNTQRAQTSAERQFFPDPDRDPEQTLGSGQWRGSSPKCNRFVSRSHPSSP